MSVGGWVQSTGRRPGGALVKKTAHWIRPGAEEPVCGATLFAPAPSVSGAWRCSRCHAHWQQASESEGEEKETGR